MRSISRRSSSSQQSFPPGPTWSFNNIPDLTGKVTLITGGNAGVGKDTVKQHLAHNTKVYLAARSAQKANAIAELENETGKKAFSCSSISRIFLPSVSRRWSFSRRRANFMCLSTMLV